MKKVRAVGLVGVAPAVVGLALPTAHGVTAAASTKTGAKTVSLLRTQAPLASCTYGRAQYATSVHDHLTAHISYSHRCVDRQEAVLDHAQSGLAERVRYYSYDGTRELQQFNAGHIDNGITSWTTFPEIFAYEVCEALVLNGNHSSVKYGPVCEDATS
jgi:hypothetical protein